MPLFSGEYPSTIDDKNRVIIPARLRQAAGEDGEKGYYLTRGVDPCIVVQTATRFEQTSASTANERIRQTTAGRLLERAIFSQAQFEQCDKQGRMLLPARLITSLGIGKNVVIVGVNDRVEIWDADRWEAELKNAEQQMAQRAEEIYGRPNEG